MARITINGQTVEVGDGNINVTSRNGKIIVNGRKLAEGLSGTVDLKIEGAVAKVDADGSVQCGDVGGSVSAGGSIRCGNVASDASAGGSITATGTLGGRVTAGGSVRIG
jgi:hypothetical protein